MQIETYKIEEINSSDASTMAADSEAIALAHTLGLEGQQTLCNPETETRFQYPRLTTTQGVVFHALFPVKTAAKHYKDGIIPLRVLQVMAYCRDFPQTKILTIWHTSSPKEDPILIGAPSDYSAEQYLLARWGDSLLPFDELQKKAVPIIRANLNSEFLKAKSRIEGYLARLDSIAESMMLTGERPTVNLYD